MVTTNVVSLDVVFVINYEFGPQSSPNRVEFILIENIMRFLIGYHFLIDPVHDIALLLHEISH